MIRHALESFIVLTLLSLVSTLSLNAYPTTKVGTPKGAFSVSALGAATYDMTFKVPYGGKLTPQIGISYNSQSGMGIVGYGCNITGISSITRGGKNIFYDRQTCGATYKSDDTYYINGTRLLLQSGTAGKEGAVYSPEGNPYTKVVVHGDCSSDASWFEVRSSDGTISKYGDTESSRLGYANRNGEYHVAAWYVGSTENQYGDYVTYNYATGHLYVRPVSIVYGTNRNRSRGIENRISFTYSDVGATQVAFPVDDQTGRISLRLSRVASYTNNNAYRQYGFVYDLTGDKGLAKYARLVRIDEMNGANDKLAPVRISWNNLPSSDVDVKTLDVPADDESEYFKANTKDFFAVDVNNDGMSDIFRVSNVDISSLGTTYNDNFLYLSLSGKDAGGTVCYTQYKRAFGSMADLPKAKNVIGGMQALDIDGDGYNDVIIPFFHRFDSKNIKLELYVLLGSEMASGNMQGASLILDLAAAKDMPLMTYFDVDGDSQDDIICIEKDKKDGVYNGLVQHFDGRTEEYEFTFARDPKKIFTADFNSDGLPDIIVFYDGGYKIYYNNGGAKGNPKFSDANVSVGTSFGDCFRIEPGDFNGDGRTDFLYFVKHHDFSIALNNGDGTFTINEKAFSLSDIDDNDTSKDDDRFTILLNDINRDGTTDVLVSKARYVYEGGFKQKYVYKRTLVKWLMFDGTVFDLVKEIVTDRKEDAEPGRLFLGDFDGDGAYEIASYGSNLYDDSDKRKDIMRVYKAGGDMASTGRISSITDGFGKTTHIYYSSASNPKVYTLGAYNRWNTKHYTLPMSLVSCVKHDNGTAGAQTVEYSYGGLKVNTWGKGMLGFSSVTAENVTLRTKENTVLSDWDENRTWQPLTKTVTRSVGTDKSVAVSTTTVKPVGNNYFAYVCSQDITDLDGNKTSMTLQYDTEKGVPIEQTLSTDGGNMYKTVKYGGYVNKSGMWMPTIMERIQKHSDDASPFSDTTVYTYDDHANVTSVVSNFASSLPLKTAYTYDIYGNIVSIENSGSGVGRNLVVNEYDNSGRFVVKSTATASSAVRTFVYDTWGNVLEESDATDPDNILTTTHAYDGWGEETSVTAPTGNTSRISTGWGNSVVKRYYVLQSPANRPWTKTWYDTAGNETFVESVGPNGIAVSKSTQYDMCGRIESTTSAVGKLISATSYEYDKRGRVSSVTESSGRHTEYGYSNRTTASIVDGREYSRTVDAWGNIKHSADPMSSVDYRYASNGKPMETRVGDVTTGFSYDDVGNKVSMADPDAGLTTYTYAADGKLLTQTDARGVKTACRYDDSGKLLSTLSGKTETTNTYGVDGADRNRLLKTECGGKIIEYTYDRFGRVILEKRTFGSGDGYTFKYAYNDKSQLESKTYPGGLVVNYEYDDYGNCVRMLMDGRVISSISSYDGVGKTMSLLGKFTATDSLDENGFRKSIGLAYGSCPLDNLSLSHDATTGNLMSRQLNDNEAERFTYDDVDRLTGVCVSGEEPKVFKYADNGNISYKSGIGNYYYNIEGLPHALSSVEDSARIMPQVGIELNYNDISRVSSIIRHDDSRQWMSFEYGPDNQRWSSTIYDDMQRFNTVYAGDYERTSTGMGQNLREFYYLGNNIIVVRKDGGAFEPYVAFTDNLGSVLSVYNGSGDKVFEASYDAWGRQTIVKNDIGLRRGYCGHEMLNEFNMINMNGRLYDPMTARFLSADNYVQLPDNSQSYNRYSYCLNNPLKYTDPSGELFGIDDIFFGIALQGMASSMMFAAYEGRNVWKAGAMSLLSSAASYGVGQVFGSVGSFGHELLRAGSHGLASGLVSALDGDGFASSFISGVAASGIGSFAQGLKIDPRLMIASTTFMGGAVAWLSGRSFIQGAMQGMSIGVLNHGLHDGEISYHKDNNGTYEGFIPEVVVTASEHLDGKLFNYASIANTIIDCLGISLKDNSGNSTYGSNNKFYWHESGERGFYGNQYVKITNLTNIGNKINKISGPVGKIMSCYDLSEGYQLDGGKIQTIGYNTTKATAGIIGDWAGGWVGVKIGGIIGGGIGGPPGAIIGGAILGIGGTILGGEIGKWTVDNYLYR